MYIWNRSKDKVRCAVPSAAPGSVLLSAKTLCPIGTTGAGRTCGTIIGRKSVITLFVFLFFLLRELSAKREEGTLACSAYAQSIVFCLHRLDVLYIVMDMDTPPKTRQDRERERHQNLGFILYLGKLCFRHNSRPDLTKNYVQ